MRIVAEEFENTTTGEKVTGVTVMIDGKLRQVFDIMIAKSGYNKSYLEMLQEVLVLGIDEYIKKLKYSITYRWYFKPAVRNLETQSKQQQKSAERSLMAWTDLICCRWGWE